METEYAIIGGGVVGLAVAFGLLSRGRRVLVLDEGDVAFRPSRGNFGLVWVQGKGLDAPAYARWTRRSVSLWRELADELGEVAEVELNLRQQGGFDYHLSEAELAERVAQYERLRGELDGDYPYEVLDNAALKREEPAVGPKVAGAILHQEDGHVNPLALLKSLRIAVDRLGGQVRTSSRVTGVRKEGEGFELSLADGGRITADKVVLAAGLGAQKLGPLFGFKAPVRPQRGQNLITEKMAPFINRPSGTIRQVNEGGVQIGDSKEEVGFDDSTTLATAADMARRAIEIFPILERAKLVRSWSALRVMSPDGLPIYQESPQMPGAFLVTCHSGITLAAAHARLIPAWIEGVADAPNLEAFSEQRFEN